MSNRSRPSGSPTDTDRLRFCAHNRVRVEGFCVTMRGGEDHEVRTVSLAFYDPNEPIMPSPPQEGDHYGADVHRIFTVYDGPITRDADTSLNDLRAAIDSAMEHTP